MPVPPSFIKNIALQLRSNYEFDNSPIEMDNDHENAATRFIGRKEQKEKLLKFLGNDSKKGVFLVTGYRGMGKTSFVNHTISQYKKERESGQKVNSDDDDDILVLPVHLTIAQNNPSELDVLKQIVNSTYETYQRKKFAKIINKQKRIQSQLQKIKTLVTTILAIDLLVLVLLFITSEFKAKYQYSNLRIISWISSEKLPVPVFMTITALAILTATLLIVLFIKKYTFDRKKLIQDHHSSYQKIKLLVERTFSSVSEEVNSTKLFNLEIKGIKAISEDIVPKKAKNFPIANAKEIEYELKAFLELTKEDNIEFIFIFDELDKIELSDGYIDRYQDLDSFEATNKGTNIQNMPRNRKQAVMNIITGLKNFFSTANARFIFIAGREMFDASLADVADKQSPLSSIFTYIFNIESLLKVEEGFGTERNTSSLTNAIEVFLNYQLAGIEEIVPGHKIIYQKNNKQVEKKLDEIPFFDFLKYKFQHSVVTEKSHNGTTEEFSKIYFFMQAFITYLAYRSNGSPKKLKKAFHEFVTIRETNGSNDLNNDQFLKDQVVIAKQQQNNNENSTVFLYFNYYNQCRIGFINYLYRPFLIQYGRSFKLFSDNAIISVPYLFDHLIKFHPFAFSRSHLELVPELLSANKTPAIKQDLDQIISYLGNTHLRDTDIELFEYKFYSRSYNEIRFLSRIFEEEAAAFNFTLDESHPVKLLLSDKIKQLRSIFSKFNKDSDPSSQQIFSIAYHNGNLGDLNFFDQGFDDAISSYSDAIRPINHLRVDSLNLRDFVTLIRNKLKIGLCFEKINSYEEALTFYSDSTQDAKRFISYHLNNAGFLRFPYLGSFSNTARETNKKELFHSSSLNDLLQIIAQCFLAKIYIQEKMGLEGISTPKIKVALGDLLKMADGVTKISGRNNLIIANVFLHLGKLLYYKNSVVPTEDADLTKGNYPAWMNERIGQAREMNESLRKDKKDIIKRQPLLAYNLYLLGLDEVMRSRKEVVDPEKKYDKLPSGLLFYNKDKKKDGEEDPIINILPAYFKVLHEYIAKHNESYTANHYKYLACLLSSLGDCLLSMYDLKMHDANKMAVNIPNKDYNKVPVTAIFNIPGSGEIDQKTDFFSLLHPGNKHYFSISDVLRCYYLSAQYFYKFGRTASASFQFRKILLVFKLVISKQDFPPASNKNFINYLEKTIVKPALEISSSSSGRTDNHMQTKAKDDLPGIPDDFIKNNIANNPDTREIKLLFEYIKLKLNSGPENINNLINSHNSLATQYARLLELDYYSKYVYEKEIKSCLDKKAELSGELANSIVAYLFSMTTILRILNIYSTDFLLGHSFIAYTHWRIANFLKTINAAFGTAILYAIKDKLASILGTGSQVIIDTAHHYAMAKDLYSKATQLHIAGDEYKKAIHDMIYLEDDFNDNAYHFGAAFDRYLLVKDVFSDQIKNCKRELGEE